MKNPLLSVRNLAASAALVAVMFAAVPTARAQTTWTNSAGDGLWNSTINWDFGVPAEFTPGVIGPGFTVNYSAPMSAANILGLTLGGTLSINSTGFNMDPLGGTPLTVQDGATLNINSSGVVTITNSSAFRMMDRNAKMTVEGGTLVFENNFGAITIGENGNTTTTLFTNNAGSITVDQSFQLRGRFTGFYMNGGTLDLQGGGGVYESSNDQERRFHINGGTANLGDFVVSRTTSGGGLLIDDGIVTATSLRIGTAASRAYSDVYGGTLTVTGDFTVCDRNNGATSSDRRIRFFVRGGEVISTSTNGIVVANQSNTGAASYNTIGGLLEVRDSGMLTAEKITLVGGTDFTNAHARLNLTGDAVINLGSGGLVGNAESTNNTSYTAELNGGTLVAKDTFTIAADLTPGGGILQTEDSGGTPHDVTMTGGLLGAGAFIKTGSGSLILQGSSSHTGDINVNEGSLVLRGDGIDSSLNINLAAGTTFDVGAGYVLNDTQTLNGEGTVSNDVAAASGSTINPGGTAVIGTMTFTDSLTQTGGVVNAFDVSTPSSGDLLVVDTLNLSGLNTVLVNKDGNAPAGAYKLIDYGTLNGNLSSLQLAGVTGSLSNNTVDGAIELILEVERPATNLVWSGDSLLNQWDAGSSSNWVSGGMSFKFLPGDNVKFDDTGSISPPVELVGDLVPNSVLVDATVNYTFDGGGKITGLTGLTKTNAGRLTLLATSDYVGITTLGGGALSVSNLADGGLPSPIGAADNDSANIVFDGGALDYQGANLTWDRGMTLNSGGGVISVTDSNTTLITTGTLEGNGQLTKRGDGTLDVRAVNNHSGGTKIEEGTLRLDRDSGATLGSGDLTLMGTTSLATFLFGGDTATVPNVLNIVGTNNLILNNGNNTFNDIIGGGTAYLGAGGDTLTIQGDMSTFSGTLVADGRNNLRLHPSTGSSNAVFDLGAGTCLLNDRNGNQTIYLGALMGGPGTFVEGASSANNPTTYIIGGLNLDTLYEGIIQERTASRKANIVKVGSGTLTLSGNSTYTGDTTVNEGVLAIIDGGGINYSANITVASGATLDVSGLFTPILYLSAGQTLRGNGTIDGDIDNSFGGVIAPGTSIGTLSVSSNANLFGTTVMEISRGSSPNSDKLVAATIALGGTLQVVKTGSNLQVGDTFDLFDGAITDNFPFMDLPAGYTFDTSGLGTGGDGTIVVTAVPTPPSIDSVVEDSGNLLVSGSGGSAFGEFHVLSSPDLAAPLSTWTHVQTNLFFNVDGTFEFTNAINPALPAEFFLIERQ